MFDDLTNVLEECIDFSLMLACLVGWHAVLRYILAASARTFEESINSMSM